MSPTPPGRHLDRGGTVLRVRGITPIDVPPDELRRRQRRYDELSPPRVEVRLDNIGAAAPRSLDHETGIRASDGVVADAAAATAAGAADLVLPDCVLDPGIDATGSVPVVGLLRLAAGHCAAAGRPFGSVTRNAAIGAELERRLERYGLVERYVGNAVLDLDLEAISDAGRWAAAVDRALGDLGARGAAVVLNGCSAVDVDDGRDGPVLVDPTRLALALLGAGHAVGLHRPDGVGAQRGGAA